MFKILGADGKEYGPVTSEQLRQWIHEGRAGGTTQVQAEGEAGWTPLQKRSEFADVFQTPLIVGGESGVVPPVVRTIAFAQFVVAAISGLWLLMNIFTMVSYASNSSFHPGFIYYFSWGFGALSLPIRIVSGVGLLRGKEWARRLAVIFAIVLALYGAWGLVRTAMMFTGGMDASVILRSPMFLISHLWSLVVFAFNLATVVLLSRKDVRAAFSRKSSPAA